MAEVKLFRKADQDFTLNDAGAAVHALVNAGFSDAMGAGIGVFEGCEMEWTVTYDELLFIHEGNFTLRVGDAAYNAGPGDTLWIPKDTPLVYEAKEKVTFFYAVYPASASPSASQTTAYPTAPPA